MGSICDRHWGRARRASALAVFGLLLLAVPAGGQTTVQMPGGPYLDFAPSGLLGDELIEFDYDPLAVTVAATPIGGGERRILLQVPRVQDGRYVDRLVAMSERRVVVRSYLPGRSGTCYAPGYPCSVPPPTPNDWLPVTTGRLGEELTPVSGGCSSFGIQGVGVSGDVIAYSEDDCQGGITVRDYAPGAAVPVRRDVLPGFRDYFQLAGRYLLVQQDRDLVVHDWVADREAYRLERDERHVPFYWTLQEDGKIALSFVDFSGRYPQVHGVAWASREEPYPHRVAVSRAFDYAPPMLRHDRIVVERGPVDSRRGEEIVVIGLGGGERVVARPSWGSPLQAFDGERIVWTRPSCFNWTVVVQQVDSPAIVDLDRAGCELRFERRPLVRGKRLRVEMDCAGFTSRDCFVSRFVVVTVRRFRTGAKKKRRRLKVAESTAPAPSNRLWLKLTPDARRLVIARGRLRVKIKAEMGAFTEDERRVGLVTLRSLRP